MNQPIVLPPELISCRHGMEIRHVTTHKSLSRWLLWGHYACPDCRTMILDHFTSPPMEVIIAGRLLLVHARHDVSSQRTG
jgi:hypothetical protein